MIRNGSFLMFGVLFVHLEERLKIRGSGAYPAFYYIKPMEANGYNHNRVRIYKAILDDIVQNKNLEQHLKDVEGAIAEINESIKRQNLREATQQA